MSSVLTHMQRNVYTFLTQFSEANGFPPSYSEIAEHFGFSSDGTVRTYLEHLEKKGYIQREGKARGIRLLKNIHRSIPIIGKIAAGSPLLSEEEFIGSISDIRELQMHTGRYALIVQGDSMKDVGIIDGDIAIIQTGVSILNGQIAAVLIEDSATLKRVFYEDDCVRLQPENKQYPPMYIDSEHLESHLLGRYIALVRQA